MGIKVVLRLVIIFRSNNRQTNDFPINWRMFAPPGANELNLSEGNNKKNTSNTCLNTNDISIPMFLLDVS